jgi:CBS domain containing-hemolysin-like protein
MSYLQPILSRLEAVARPADRPEDVYEKEDLQEFINRQNTRPDNRIPESDLKMAFNALTFGDKKIGDIMTPLRKVRMVAENEQVGPLLMDELHSTGFSRFPVTGAGDKANIIGTLYIKDLLEKNDRATVSQLMDKKVYFVNETQNLREALNAFLKTHHHLFIVVNSFEETVGVVSIEDVLEQILGQEIVDEFDHYDDLRAVAAKEAAAEHKEHRATHPEPIVSEE